MIRFSVVIPTCNRPEPLAACLAALGRLDFPRDGFEVIVVDDGSDRPIDEAVTRVASPLDVFVLTLANAGPASARNAAVERARGHYLAFTDDDCLPAADWLTRLDERFQQNPNHMVGGRTINAAPGSPCASLSQLIVDAAYEHYNVDPGHAVFFAANNMTVPAAPFRELGGFDAAFRTAEDRDLCDRWRRHGLIMTFAPEVVIHHAPRLTLARLCRQHFGYGRGAYRFHRKRTKSGEKPFRPEVAFYGRLMERTLSQYSGLRGIQMLTLLLVQQVANAAGFVWESLHRRGVRSQPRAVAAESDTSDRRIR